MVNQKSSYAAKLYFAIEIFNFSKDKCYLLCNANVLKIISDVQQNM